MIRQSKRSIAPKPPEQNRQVSTTLKKAAQRSLMAVGWRFRRIVFWHAEAIPQRVEQEDEKETRGSALSRCRVVR